MGGEAGSRADQVRDVVAPGIGPLSAAEISPLAAVLARAFRDNPLNVAVVQSDDPAFRIRCNFHGMRALLPVAQTSGQVLTARLEGRLAGALVAVNPYGYPLPAPPLAARLRCFWGQGWRVARRWGRVFESLDALHPLEPLGYLGTLGVDPSFQGRGVGTALLACWLAGLDREATGAYLETDRCENVAFYERSGFRVLGETRVLGARIWRMRRPAAVEGRAAGAVVESGAGSSTQRGD
jgi:ribosomal protein S18 acetylase RimI-like enzyme